ncbi:MAG: hypothetical protein FWC53_01160 [Firmicutes bacterium]|nr:hypothetical protein [Bacillota bacterium]
MMRGQKGITLVALVITIIVMLILAGVTITIAVNGGIFTQANNAKIAQSNAAVDDAITAGTADVLGEFYALPDAQKATYTAEAKLATTIATEGGLATTNVVAGTGIVTVTNPDTKQSKKVNVTVDTTNNTISISPVTNVGTNGWE